MRLIDADKIIDSLGGSDMDFAIGAVIDEQPTAFDADNYEVMTLYPYCVLLRDTRNGVRTCPGYNTLSLMLRGSEALAS